MTSHQAPHQTSHHLHNPTGITDEAAIEGHDLIHNAEVEEQKLHGKSAMTEEDPEPQQKSALGDSSQSDTKKEGSAMDKVKEALNMKK
ncbi:hypothetical protein AK830_g4411 [Neonectria ditissima]|uniref:Uncharacterized protein n=1 Tax=Neonectria ditissima TaxID=78410 RepID=A0A0P7BN43_9HYPO|nr:hypothetical protein AK830_g4411 [Neonectria ditissima]